MARKEYTDAEKAAYKAGRAAKGGTRSRSTTTARTTKRRYKSKDKKRRSGCTFEASYTPRTGPNAGRLVERPRIRGWRYVKGIRGIQRFTAFLGANDGVPKNPKTAESGDRFRVFVANMVTEGQGSHVENCIYDTKYRKLKFVKLGLVANPELSGGGYFGRGGQRYKNKVK